MPTQRLNLIRRRACSARRSGL